MHKFVVFKIVLIGTVMETNHVFDNGDSEDGRSDKVSFIYVEIKK